MIVAMSDDLWFRGMEFDGEERPKRRNAKETKAHWEAMVLRTKPEANKWLHLTPRIASLGVDAFDRGPTMITKIHAYLVRELSLAENEGEKSAEFTDRICQITLEVFWTQNMRGDEGFEGTDSMLERLGGGWTASYLLKNYPGLSDYLIKEFLKAITGFSTVVNLGLFVAFGAEIFIKGPAVLLTEGIQNLRLDGLLKKNAITYGTLGGLINLTHYPEQMKEKGGRFDMKKSTDAWTKIRDLRHTLIQYLLQQNCSGTGE